MKPGININTQEASASAQPAGSTSMEEFCRIMLGLVNKSPTPNVDFKKKTYPKLE